jgi:aspartyl protease family protein
MIVPNRRACASVSLSLHVPWLDRRRTIGIEAMRGFLCFAIFIIIVGVGLSKEIGRAFTSPSEGGAAVKASPLPQSYAVSSGSRTVKLDADSRGHFRVDARVDGRSIDLIVDTGASLVVINESSAARLGIFPRASDYVGRSQTANGVSKFAPVRLSRVEINGITVRDVDAAVKPDELLKTNLLGMSFLSRVKWSYDRGRLVLEQ